MYDFLNSRCRKEFEEKLQAKMEEKKIDALLLTSPENLFYGTGYISNMYKLRKVGSDIAIVPASGKVSLITSQFTQGGAELQTKGEVDVIGYPVWIFFEDYYDPNEKEKSVQPDLLRTFRMACEIIKSKKEDAVVGIEADTMPYDKYMFLVETFGADKLVDIGKFMIEIRTIKSPWEIDVLRYSAQTAEKMMNITMWYTEPGMTEADLFKIWWQTGYELTGGHEVVSIGQDHTLGSDFWGTTMPRERPLEKGDIVRLDGGINIYGYTSDLGRVYAVSNYVSSDKQAIFDTLLAARDAGIKQFVPGNKFSDVFHATMKVCHEGALPHFVRGHVGHTIGLGPGEEYPMLNPANNMIFKPGMVLCFETPYYSSRFGSYNLEDTLVITEDGHELFTNTNRSLFIR